MLVASAGAFAVLISALALVNAQSHVAFVLAILLTSGIARSLQMTGLSSMQFADVPREKMTGASTYASVNQNVVRAVGIALAALAINMATGLRGGSDDAPSIGDFHIAFIGAGLLSLGAMLRYLTLPRDAGRHVSAGR